MKTKYAIMSIVLIALMCGFLVPIRVLGFQTGPGAPNTNWQEYGPQMTTLWIHGYSGYTAEEAALAAKNIDFIDTTLLPNDYTSLYNEGGFSFNHITELDIDELDFNRAFLPFNNTDYTLAVCNMLNTDKTSFVNTILGQGAEPAYSPVPGDILANAGYNWYNASTSFPGTGGLYSGGYAFALTELLGSGIPLTQDLITSPGTYATWNFSAPFPIASNGVSYNPLCPSYLQPAYGYNGMGDGADNAHGVGGIQVLNRVEDTRVQIGPEVQEDLGPRFAAWYSSLPPTSTYVTDWKDALSSAGLPSTLLPYIEVAVENVYMSAVIGPVFTVYCSETYTGSYSYTILPSGMMDNYETTNAPQAFGWAPYHDDTCYYNPTFTGYEQLSENSTTQGSYAQTGSGVYWEQIAQYELMGGSMGPPIMPYWDYVGYSPTLTSDYNCIGEPGVGMNNWYSFLNAYPTSGSYLASSNAMTYGMRSVTEDECNVVSASAFYDYQVINEIYDTLAIGNPYNPSSLVPYIATGWTTGTWANPGTGKTDSQILVNLRNNVEWQDVPGPENRARFTTNDGNELNGPITDKNATVLDEAFTLEYGAVGWAYDITYDVTTGMYVDHVDVSPANYAIWNSEWAINSTQDGYAWQNMTAIENYLGISPSQDFWPYYQATTPGPGYPGYYNTTYYMQNFVRPDASLNSTEIEVYMSADWPWMTQYYVLGSVILPMDVFSHLAINPMGWSLVLLNGKHWTPLDECTMDLEPHSYNSGTGADLLYGTGPYVLVDDPAAVPTTNFRLDAYVKGLSYGGITLDHSYFLYGKVPTTLLPQTGTATATSHTLGSGLNLTFSQTLLNHNSTAPAVGTYSWEYTLWDPDGVNITNVIKVPGGTFNLNKYGATNDSYTFTKTLALTRYGDPLEVVWGMIYTVTSGAPSAYLSIPDTVSHTNIFTFNQGYVGLRNGWDLTFNQTVVNPTGSAGAISYYWNYNVMMYNVSDSQYDIPITSGNTATVNRYSIAADTSAVITGAVVLDNNTITNFNLEVLWSFIWNDTVGGPLYQIDYGAPTPIYIINTNSYSYGFTPGDISQYTVSLAASWASSLGTDLPLATPTINYGWTVTLMEWDPVTGAYDIPIASNGTTGSFVLTSAGYSVSPTVLLNLPPSWGASPYVAPPWGNWLNMTVNFQWTYGSPTQHDTYVTPSTTGPFTWAPGDLNQDGVANGLDLGIMASAWLSSPGALNWNPAADINNDGVVNGLDVGILANYWQRSYAILPPPPSGP